MLCRASVPGAFLIETAFIGETSLINPGKGVLYTTQKSLRARTKGAQEDVFSFATLHPHVRKLDYFCFLATTKKPATTSFYSAGRRCRAASSVKGFSRSTLQGSLAAPVLPFASVVRAIEARVPLSPGAWKAAVGTRKIAAAGGRDALRRNCGEGSSRAGLQSKRLTCSTCRRLFIFIP